MARMQMAVMVAAMMVIMPHGVAASTDECPTGLVYPHWSTCRSPAKYAYDGGIYELGDSKGSLAPEWDETNSTYYVRLAEVGAQYEFTHLTRELRFAVAQSDDVIIKNVETRRALGWRQEGDDYFLVELSTEDQAESSSFQFSKDDDVVLPCDTNVVCEVYFILNYTTSLGLTPYVEDGATYFTLSHTSSALDFVLKHNSTSSSHVDFEMANTAPAT